MKKTNLLTNILTVSFLFLCILHYLSPRPLWLDEGFVLRSLVKFSGVELFTVLEQAQSFPRIYLMLIQLISEPFNFHPRALRFLSFIFMVTAFFIWKKLYKIHTVNDKAFVFLLLAFVGSYKMSYFASELKPYSMDVLVVALYALFLHYQKDFTDKSPTIKLYLYALLLPALLPFSYAGI